MVDLLNTKIWVNNDRDLIKKIENLAFSLGFVYSKKLYSQSLHKYNYLKGSQKHSNNKKIYALFFYKNIADQKEILCNYIDYKYPITKYNTHKDRFNNVVNTNQLYGNLGSKTITEIFIKDLQLNTIYELW